MNVADYRSSFTVFVADANLDRGRELTSAIALMGYAAEQRVNAPSLLEEIKKNPPHHILMHYSDEGFFQKEKHRDLIDKILAVLPETHIFILATPNDFEKALGLYEFGVYDVLRWPTHNSIEVVRALDRAAETDYHSYRNEQLLEQVGDKAVRGAQADFGLYEVFLKELDSAKDREAMLALTTKELARRFQSDESLYLRYVPGAGTLVVAGAYGISSNAIEGVGIDLKKNEPGFVAEMLLKPSSMRSLMQFVRDGLLRNDFIAFPHHEGQVVRGLFLIPARNNEVYSESLKNDAYAHVVLKGLYKALEFRDLRSRFDRLSVYDNESESLKMEYFLQKIREEVSRARRIARPVAILILSVDGLQDLRLEQNQNVIEQFLKSFVQILSKNSRLNDFMGRLADDQFSLVLPHTDKRGAAIKAERIRRMIETADFSEILVGRKKITISMGVSEYPSICSDSDGLVKSAEEALNEVRRFGNNRVCLATPPARFVPDFGSHDGSTV